MTTIDRSPVGMTIADLVRIPSAGMAIVDELHNDQESTSEA
jgi:hypothetical protein